MRDTELTSKPKGSLVLKTSELEDLRVRVWEMTTPDYTAMPDWHGNEFTADSPSHVSVWRKPQ